MKYIARGKCSECGSDNSIIEDSKKVELVKYWGHKDYIVIEPCWYCNSLIELYLKIK